MSVEFQTIWDEALDVQRKVGRYATTRAAMSGYHALFWAGLRPNLRADEIRAPHPVEIRHGRPS